MRKEAISYMLPFSAKSEEALENTYQKVIRHLEQKENVSLRDAAWTLQKGRRVFDKRKVLIASRDDFSNVDQSQFCIISNSEQDTSVTQKKENLVFVLPDCKDTKGLKDVWSQNTSETESYPLLKKFYSLTEQVLNLFPREKVNEVKDTNNEEQGILAIRAFLIGYATTNILLSVGIQPTALAGEGVAELAAMTCAGALTIQDSVDILTKYEAMPTYESVYCNYAMKNKTIPVMRKAGKKAKLHMDDAVIIKLGSKELSNDITRRCMVDVAPQHIITLIQQEDVNQDTFICNLYSVLAKLWCEGAQLNWELIMGKPNPSKVPLPTYAFEKRIFDCDVRFGGFLATSGQDSNTTTTATIIDTRDVAEVLKDLWKDALGITDPKKEDDFFELGGSSLDAIMLSSKIKELLRVDFQMSEMFDHSTFGKMEKYIQQHKEEIEEDVIHKLGKQPYYETSSAQKRMYAVNEMLEDSIPYNFACVYQVNGILDREKIQSCFAQLVQRHEAFRTRFEMVGDEVVQIIEENVDFKVDFQTSTKEELDNNIQANIQPFDLSKAPLLRVVFISVNETEHVMILDMHHIISDQSSLDVLLREIGMIYQNMPLPELDIQYKDFAKWQNDFFRSGAVKQQLDYWKNEFANGIPVLDLYTDYNRPEVMEYEGGIVHFTMPDSLNEKVTACSKKYGVTPYMFTMAALNILLWKYTRQKDIVVGTAIAGRKHAKLENIVGMFVNTLAIKSEIQEQFTVEEYLHYIKEKMVNAYDNQDCQFDMLVEELGIPKNSSRNPLFDVLFNYINIGTDEVEIEGLNMEPYGDDELDVKFDLTFTLEEKEQAYYLDIEYAKVLFKEETIKLMGNRFFYVIEQMVDESLANLEQITLITEEERTWLLETVNETATDYPADKTVLQVFEQCVSDTPDLPAIEWMDEIITYKQLNNMANQLAQLLKAENVGYQDMVPILLERGPRQMISMLGIMKLGAIYIPVDPKYPQERIDYILEDCKSSILLTEGDLEEKVKGDMKIIKLDDADYALAPDNNSPIESPLTPEQMNSEDLIYAIYTSGSTGKPKGTLLKHKNVVRVVKNTNYIDVTKEDRVMQISNYVFDCSVFDIYSALLNSACLVIIPRETALEIPSLADFIKEKKISAFCISTALFHMLVDWKPEALMDVRKVIVAGEQISLAHAKKTIEVIGKDKLINCYGPTESAVFATYYAINDLSDASIVPIGAPLANTTVYVTDENQNLLPINVVGELCLGGDGIGKGYLNQEELTNEKFISLEVAGGKRVYRTGDRVMWNTDRELIFLGRMDFQIKLRGFRVELGEVERHIEGIDGIKNVVVTADTDNLGTLFMTAYYTVDNYSEKDKFGESYIRNILENKLPEYMIPTKYMLLKQFPLNFSGKVDRKALPKVENTVEQTVTAKDKPRTKTETIILEAMKKILDVEELGIRDDFFRCGGQSIKAIALVKELSRQGITIKVNEVFVNQTVEKIAATIEPYEEVSESYEECEVLSDITINEMQVKETIKSILERIDTITNMIQVCDVKKTFPMSAIQIGHLSQGSSHSGFRAEIQGRYREKSIRMAVGQVISDNQLLHCSLDMNETKHWMEYDIASIQKILGNYLTYADISMYTDDIQANIRQAVCDAILNKNYASKELLWRVCILKVKQDVHEIVWGANHLVFDGMSGEVMLRQIEQALGKKGQGEVSAIQDYDEYVELLKAGPQDITQEEIIDSFQLKDWQESNARLMEEKVQATESQEKRMEIKIPLNQEKQTDIWWYAFDLVSNIVRAYYDIETVPFAILDYGRSYQEKDFYNSVGEFLDIVPIVNQKGKKTSIEEVLSTCRTHGINFLTLLKEENLRETYADVNALLRNYYYTEHRYFDFILYNFQGFVTSEEKNAFAHVEESTLSRTCIVVNYDEEHLYIEIEDVEGIDGEKVKQCAKKIMKAEGEDYEE